MVGQVWWDSQYLVHIDIVSRIRALLCLAVLISEVPSPGSVLGVQGQAQVLGRSALVGPSVFSI